MKFSELKGRAIIEINTSQKIGEFEDILLDPASLKPLSVKVKTGLFDAPRYVPVAQVKGVGPDAITVTQDPGNLAEPEGAQEARQISGMLGDKVVTDAGTLVGEVHDLVIDAGTLSIQAYEVKTGGLFARSHEIPATPEVRHGPTLITVPASIVPEAI